MGGGATDLAPPNVVGLQEADEQAAKEQELVEKARTVARSQQSAAAGGARTAGAARGALAAPAKAAGSATATPKRSSDGASSPRQQQQHSDHEHQEARPEAASSSPQQQPNASGGDGCAHCGAAAAADRKLLICTQCRGVKYCSGKCQAAAWPSHKRACKLAVAAKAAAAAADTSSGDDQQQQQQPGAKPEGAEDLDAESVLSALGGILQRHADSRTDTLQQQFESAVVRFVRGDHSAAVSDLEAVLTRARAEGRLDIAADALRWLGHTHNRLDTPARAVAAFAEGAATAQRAGSKRLEVDCLTGLGVVHRDQGQADAAVGFLKQALAVAETVEGAAAAGVRAGVVTNLGTALMRVNVSEAADILQLAVELREKQVGFSRRLSPGAGAGWWVVWLAVCCLHCF